MSKPNKRPDRNNGACTYLDKAQHAELVKQCAARGHTIKLWMFYVVGHALNNPDDIDQFGKHHREQAARLKEITRLEAK